ncbi:chitinase-like protein PB1E7.04c isoform X2 [Aplysia californica]|uniref:Chitinase-like protein PB1E7.04c isoform X2 n=1 Tax=Aplysia californica TaxID=6500 RepID=A0ABM0K7N5_APLCA|nr:chitinase-like protein PB1E7.04c isoform X2 [Aplysia californica]
MNFDMPSETGFSFIEQYKFLSRELHEQSQTCTDMVSMDQEVPQARSYLEAGDIKTEVKMESPNSQQQVDIDMYMAQILASTESSIGSNTDTITISSSRNSDISVQPQYIPLTVSATSSSPEHNINTYSSSSSFSSVSSGLHSASSSPLLSSVAVSSLDASSTTSFPSIVKSEPKVISESSGGLKTRTFVTELGGSGCTLVTPSEPNSGYSTDFLSGDSYPSSTHSLLSENVAPPSMCVPEGSFDYLDLDKQPSSFYDDVRPMSEPMKLESFTPAAEGSDSLEEAVVLMRDVIHHDCDKLNVPYDPMLWDVENVQTWVSWVCQKNNFSNISAQFHRMNGRVLCSLQASDFASYGRVGESLSTELELWKAANSCFPELSVSSHHNSFMQHQQHQQQQQQLPHFLEKDLLCMSSNKNNSSGFGLGPCVSPAPSTGSSSQDSLHTGSLTDNSDDENSFSMFSSASDLSSHGNNKTSSSVVHPVTKLGRGHKQTIHLWQFLRELLLSKENHSDCIRWLDRSAGVFKIEDSKKVAFLWGERKNRPAMNYDKLSRSVRQYYKKGIIKKADQPKRLVYQFCAGYM